MENKSSWFWLIIPSLIAILSGMSVGSGGLLVIWLTEFAGVGADTARALNLFFFTFSAVTALFFHLKRRKLNLRLILNSAFFALFGTVLGTFLGKGLEPSVLKKLFGAFLIISGGYYLFSGKKEKGQEKPKTIQTRH